MVRMWNFHGLQTLYEGSLIKHWEVTRNKDVHVGKCSVWGRCFEMDQTSFSKLQSVWGIKCWLHVWVSLWHWGGLMHSMKTSTLLSYGNSTKQGQGKASSMDLPIWRQIQKLKQKWNATYAVHQREKVKFSRQWSKAQPPEYFPYMKAHFLVRVLLLLGNCKIFGMWHMRYTP